MLINAGRIPACSQERTMPRIPLVSAEYFYFNSSTQQIEELRKEKENFRVLIVPTQKSLIRTSNIVCILQNLKKKCINPIKSFISRTTSRPSINDLIMCNKYMVKQLLQEILTICNIIQIRDNKISGCKGKALGSLYHT